MTTPSPSATPRPDPDLDAGVAVTFARRAAPPLRRTNEPVTFGFPMPRSAATTADAFTLHDADGGAVPTDARVLNRWSDGSIRWLLLDAQVSVDDDRDAAFTLRRGPRPVAPVLTVREEAGRVRVDTGAAEVVLATGSASPFEQVRVGTRLVLDAARSGIAARDERDRPCAITFDRVAVEHAGALTAAVVADGVARGAAGERLLEVTVHAHFFAGSPTVRLRVRTRNPRRAEHPGGFWDLGDPGSVLLRDLSLTFALPGTGAETGGGEGEPSLACSPELDAPFASERLPFSLYQDSSGGENWQSSNHINRHRVVPNTFRGYRVRSGDTTREGLRATPSVSLRRGDTAVAATVPYFWQNFPQAIEATADAVTVRLFPQQYADAHEVQGGEEKTHELFVSFAPDGVTEEPLAWCRARLVPHAGAAWYAAAAAAPYLTGPDSPESRPHVALVNAAVDGDDTFERKREVIDQYGWRHFGEVYGDHEAVFHAGPTPLVSHYNNQYDPVFGFACQFFRTGDARWWTQMDELARHVVDIDIYHTTEDKSAYNRGLFWHTYHYGDADTAHHRTYPRASAGKTHGGGPSSEHNYATGLMLHYFLTGDAASRDAAVGLGRFVIDMDDGTKTVFRFLDRGHTGLASASGSYAYHGPGRGGGNSLSALLDAMQLTGDRAFLDKAEQIVRRCIHPNDDVPARNLLDAERKWFYTMFLQALGKYLDHKIERGEIDAMYAYARASLLHYARWMAEHEFPQLDKPERLEYPTETWAAQDIRKSDVFHHAARHASGAERERFRERGAFFFRYATGKLAEMPTRTLARPVIVLLSNGWFHAWASEHPEAQAPAPGPPAVTDFGKPETFVPQKARAKKRAKILVAAGAGLVLALLVALAWRLLAQ